MLLSGGTAPSGADSSLADVQQQRADAAQAPLRQQVSIDEQAKSVAHAQHQQQLINEQFAATDHNSAVVDSVRQQQMQDASAAFAASGAAAAVGDKKCQVLADMAHAMKAEGAANVQAQVAF